MKIKKRFILAITAILSAAALGGQVEAAEPSDDAGKTEESEAAIEFIPGPLTLDKVPEFHFGEKDIQATEQSYSATTLDSALEVIDLRGTGAGWRVTATMGNFLNDEEKPVFEGAELVLGGGTLQSERQSDAPIVNSKNDNEPIKLTVGEGVAVVTADSTQGMGAWTTEWSLSGNITEGVHLKVPAGLAMKGNHTAEIIWTLENTP